MAGKRVILKMTGDPGGQKAEQNHQCTLPVAMATSIRNRDTIHVIISLLFGTHLHPVLDSTVQGIHCQTGAGSIAAHQNGQGAGALL